MKALFSYQRLQHAKIVNFWKFKCNYITFS